MHSINPVPGGSEETSGLALSPAQDENLVVRVPAAIFPIDRATNPRQKVFCRWLMRVDVCACWLVHIKFSLYIPNSFYCSTPHHPHPAPLSVLTPSCTITPRQHVINPGNGSAAPSHLQLHSLGVFSSADCLNRRFQVQTNRVHLSVHCLNQALAAAV